MAFSIDIKGDLQGELLEEFNRIKDDIEELLAVNMGEAAKEVQTKIPVNKRGDLGGFLKSGFTFQQVSDFEYSFENDIKYAPFVDFGTGSQVQIPAGMEAFAREFYRTGRGRTPAQPFMSSVVQKYWLQFLDDVLKIP
jgi:hypothetical protein